MILRVMGTVVGVVMMLWPAAAQEEKPGAPTPQLSPSPPPIASPTSAPPVYASPPNVSLVAACPEMKGTAKLESDARDAHVVASFERERELRKQIALSYFKCADKYAKRVDERGRYAHDKALLMYAIALRDSLASPPDSAAIAQLKSALDELQATALFADVHDGTQALAASLPAGPTTAPTPALVDMVACRETNFAALHQAWSKALRTWSTDVDTTNRAGALGSTLLSQINYGVQGAAERNDVAKLAGFEEPLRAAIDTMRSARAVDTAKLASVLLEKIHEVNGYAASFTSTHHRGAAAVSDREHLHASKLAADAAAVELRDLPYCSK